MTGYLHMVEIINSYTLGRSILLVLFLWTLIVSIIKTKNTISNVNLVLISCITFFIILIKPYETPDYENYIGAYLYTSSDSSRFEPAWKLFKEIFKSYNLEFYFIIGLYAILGIILKLSVICKASPFIWLSILIWLSHIFILQDLIQIRASVASGFLLWAIYFKCINSNFHALLCIIAGTLFHYSCVLGILILLLSKTRNYKYLYTFSLFISIFIGLIGISFADFIPNALLSVNQSLEGAEKIGVFTKMNLFRCLYAFILWYFCDRIKGYNNNFLILLKIYTIGCCVMFLFSRPAIIGLRVSEFLCATEIILLPMILYIFPSKQRRYYKLIPILSAVLLFISSYTSSLYFPYIYE